MIVTVNGTAVDLETGEYTLGEVLAQADDLVEKAGSVILALALDGKTVDPDTLPSLRDTPARYYSTLEIDSVPAFELRSRAYVNLLELLDALKEWAQGSAPSSEVRSAWTAFGNTFSGLLSSDEHSFLDMLVRDIESLKENPSPSERIPLTLQAERLMPIFRERLEEITSPAASMRAAAMLYAAESDNLLEVPVRLQTGKDAEAMRSILLFVEIFNKVTRILPELSRTDKKMGNMLIDGKSLSEFYQSFNTILRQLMQAFETKDAVLIGDLAEYEIVPRMNSFFKSLEGVLK